MSFLRRALSRTTEMVDEARARLTPPSKLCDFVIVTTAYNAEEYIRRNIDSVWDQDYPNAHYRQIIIDDVSEDVTTDLVKLFTGDTPAANIELIENGERVGGCQNLTTAFRAADPNSIILQVDGDDWLPDNHVLTFLNQLYQDPDLWMTYNSWIFPDKSAGRALRPHSPRTIENRSYRDEPWCASHLHSFRARLFQHVRDDSLIDPETGKPWSAAVDMSHYFPMLELAGRHARHVERPLYVYNLHPGSIENHDKRRQQGCEDRIRALPRYTPLTSLG